MFTRSPWTRTSLAVQGLEQRFCPAVIVDTGGSHATLTSDGSFALPTLSPNQTYNSLSLQIVVDYDQVNPVDRGNVISIDTDGSSPQHFTNTQFPGGGYSRGNGRTGFVLELAPGPDDKNVKFSGLVPGQTVDVYVNGTSTRITNSGSAGTPLGGQGAATGFNDQTLANLSAVLPILLNPQNKIKIVSLSDLNNDGLADLTLKIGKTTFKLNLVDFSPLA